MKTTPLLTKCRIATNNGNAAALLYRILFWMPKAKITHGGRRRIANSAVQWCKETGLTYDQYRRAIALLKKLGFVETEQHLFFGKNATHVRTTALGDEIRMGACLGSSQTAPLNSGKTASPEPSSNAQLSIQGGSYLEGLQGETTTAFASAHADIGIQKEKVDPGKTKLNDLSKAKSNCSPVDNIATDVPDVSLNGAKMKMEISASTTSGGQGVAFNQDGQLGRTKTAGLWAASVGATGPASDDAIDLPLQPNGNAEKVEELAKAWEAIVQDVYGDYVPPGTKKRLKQLKDFRDQCPPGQAKATLEVCLRNWDDFATHSKLFYAAWSIPDRPMLEFLLKYIEAATNFAIQQKPKSKLPLPTKDETPLPTKKSVPHPAVDFKAQFYAGFQQNKKATAEEVQTILNEEDEPKSDVQLGTGE
jgi:hypothetical protein